MCKRRGAGALSVSSRGATDTGTENRTVWRIASIGVETTVTVPLWLSALAGTLLVQTACAFASISVPILGPPLMERAGLPPESIGLVAALSSAGICWFLASGGPMLGRFGPVRTLQIGMVCMALGFFALSLPLGFLGMLGALAIGLGNGPNTPAGSQILIRSR